MAEVLRQRGHAAPEAYTPSQLADHMERSERVRATALLDLMAATQGGKDAVKALRKRAEGRG